MHTKPWLSIICPTYNGGKFLTQTLDSITTQNEKEIECIIIDDGSTDNTISLIEDFQTKFPVTLIHKKNQNWVSNTNFAISQSNGTYVCFLHQDDFWLPERLSTIKKITLKQPEIGFIIHPSVFVNADGKTVGLWQCPLPKYPKIIDSEKLITRLLIQNFISIPGVIFKQDVFTEMDERLWYTADWDLWLNIARKTNTIYLSTPLSAFRVHSNSQTAKKSFDTNGFKNQLETVFQKHFSEINLPYKKKKDLQRIAEFSIGLNVSLAQVFHKEKANYLQLIISFIMLNPIGWYRYIRNSRIIERVLARLQVNLKH